ncbi:MAG: (d)CMP kinase [Ktedonobacterales bacterium]
MRTHLQIAIDGPAGVGKSTIGERLARQLGYLYVDTGAFYRTLTYAALQNKIPPDDALALGELARAIHIEIGAPATPDGRQYTVLLDGKDITPELRTPSVEGAVSGVSSHEPVRTTLIEHMRKMADEKGVVMVGRDIGTVVLPEADLKIFLTTSILERAKRRHGDLVAIHGSNSPSLATVEREIAQRDAIDAPHTRVAGDAVILNNDHLEADDVVRIILEIMAKRRNQGQDR